MSHRRPAVLSDQPDAAADSIGRTPSRDGRGRTRECRRMSGTDCDCSAAPLWLWMPVGWCWRWEARREPFGG